MEESLRSTERLIGLLASVNATAIDNDSGKPGDFLAGLCHEAAERLRELDHLVDQHRQAVEHIGDDVVPPGYTIAADGFLCPRRDDDGMPALTSLQEAMIEEGFYHTADTDHGC
jgi:hypothetical protein